MLYNELMSLFRGPTEIAKLLGIRQPSVQDWRRADGSVAIPELRLIQLAVEIERRSAGKITRQSLFPDTWQRYWPELTAQPPEPEPAAPPSPPASLRKTCESRCLGFSPSEKLLCERRDHCARFHDDSPGWAPLRHFLCRFEDCFLPRPE